MNSFEDCLKSGKLRKFSVTKEKIKIEIKSAREDLKEAKDRFNKKKYKYATITAYYSLFHSARALLYSRGYRERSHYCLKIAIEKLFVKEKILDTKFIDYFEEALGLREAADYQSLFSKDGAQRAVKEAREFFKEMKEICS